MGVEELRAKAPQMTAWAERMRELFGDVSLRYVREGEFTLGKPVPGPWAEVVIEKKKRR